MLGLLARAAGSQGRTAGSMQLLRRRNEQLGQKQGLQSNSFKKNLINRRHSLTLRERAGSRECPSSVGFLNTLHFPSSALSVPNSDYSKRAHPSQLRSAWKVADRSQAKPCSSTLAMQGSSGLFTPQHFRISLYEPFQSQPHPRAPNHQLQGWVSSARPPQSSWLSWMPKARWTGSPAA